MCTCMRSEYQQLGWGCRSWEFSCPVARNGASYWRDSYCAYVCIFHYWTFILISQREEQAISAVCESAALFFCIALCGWLCMHVLCASVPIWNTRSLSFATFLTWHCGSLACTELPASAPPNKVYLLNKISSFHLALCKGKSLQGKMSYTIC